MSPVPHWKWYLLAQIFSLSIANLTEGAIAQELKPDTVPAVSIIAQSISSKSPPTPALSSPDFTIDPPLILQNSDPVLEQLTSVSQLSDVQPTDWSFQALQSLVERYGCVAGYPNSTFQGNRAATRYELAAVLNACLEQVSDRFATEEDLETVKALQEEFKIELTTLSGRVDSLEARAATLEAQQFSTTTKLSGQAFFNLTGAFAGNGLKANGVDGIRPFRAVGQPDRDPITNQPRVRVINNDPNPTLSGLVWLNFNTSFSGKDLLTLQLATGNGNSPANAFASAGLFNTWGTPFTDNGYTSGVVFRELSYTFPITKNLKLSVGPRLNFYKYFDNNAFTFFPNGASSYNSIGSSFPNASRRGAGAVLTYTPTQKLQFRLGYLSQSNEFLPPELQSAPNPEQGLFGGTNTLTAEVTYSPIKTLNLRFLYTRTNIQSTFGGLIGGTSGFPVWGLADDGFGGGLNNATANTFGFNFDWLVTKGFGVFGRYTFATTNLDPITPGRPSGQIQNQAIQFGLAFPDLGKKGAKGTLSLVMPSDVLKGRQFLISGGGDGGTQYDLEAYYYYPISDNIAIVPAFYTIFNANNFSDNPTVFVGNLRMQFSF
jgi:hypothetical protein